MADSRVSWVGGARGGKTPSNKQNSLLGPTECVFYYIARWEGHLCMYIGRTVDSSVRNPSMRYGRASGGECPWLLLLLIFSTLNSPASRPNLRGGHSRPHHLRAGERARQEDLVFRVFRVMNSCKSTMLLLARGKDQ